MGRRFALLLTLLPCAAPADVLSFAIWPDRNPAHSIACRIELFDGQIIAVEVMGMGMPPRHPLRWHAGLAERAAIRAALGSLLTGDLPSVDRYSFWVPNAPYVTVIWSTILNGAAISGLYVHQDLNLPAVMDRVLTRVMPGSGCDRAVP